MKHQQQRLPARAVKNARETALLPYSAADPEAGHRYTTTSVRYTTTSAPRPGSGFSGTVDVRLLASAARRTPRVRRAGADPARPADWTITWTLEQEGRAVRLFLVHEGFDPDDPARLMARKIMDGGWRSHVMRAPGKALERLVKQP
ncbi:SRPBCC domain-containing protein [Streptomyces avermitilis]|uniref:SRPBCC domain-containing protein n=1 Tax=Streptomyces avermitilis TaxID=33903 RepID=UPI00339ED486